MPRLGLGGFHAYEAPCHEALEGIARLGDGAGEFRKVRASADGQEVAEDGSLQLEVETVLGLQNGAAVAELVAAEPALAEEPALAQEPAPVDEHDVAESASEPEPEPDEASQTEPESLTQSMEV